MRPGHGRRLKLGVPLAPRKHGAPTGVVGGTGDASAPASVEGERREAEAAGTVVGRARAGAGRGLAAGRAPWRRAVVA